MVVITEADKLENIYHYQQQFQSPFFFPVDYETWKESFETDADGAGRTLFKTLTLKAAYDNGQLVGFIQYGPTAFGFDSSGEVSSDVSYCVIRNLYFDEGRADAGRLLLREAMDAFAGADRVYAFFHYFGMSCFGRHGKLFEKHSHIEDVLRQGGFVTEHENVYDCAVLKGGEASGIVIAPQDLTEGHQQYVDFLMDGNQTGGCEVHFVDKKTAYLRWIYVNADITGRGVGSRCMAALKHWLYQKGIVRFDTDTALDNTVAQHFYEKNGFTRAGITRSFYREIRKETSK